MKLFKVVVLLALVSFSMVSAVEISQFGLVLGGNYSWLSGKDANQMGAWVDSSSFTDGRNPFGYITDPNMSVVAPSGSFGIEIGAFSRLDLNDDFYLRIEANYIWKGGEYQTTLPAVDTYLGGDSTVQALATSLTPPDTVQDGMRRWVISNSYLELPVLVGYNIFRELSVYGGPHISYLISKKFDAHFTETETQSGEGQSLGTNSYYGIDPGYASFDFGFDLGVGYQFSDQFQAALRWSPGFSSILDRSPAVTITQSTLQLQASLNFSEF